MKKLVVASALSLTVLAAVKPASAQTNAMLQLQSGTLDKAKAAIDKDVSEGSKAASKAKTWLVRGQVYEAIALDQTGVYSKLDTNAAMTAYESYKKGLEVEPNGGKSGKELNEALAGQKLYSAFMNQGASRYQSKNYAGALKLMTMAGAIMPKDTMAALYAGIAAQQAQMSGEAKEQLERYAANGGKDPSVFYSLASLYRNDKEIDKALGAIDKGLTALPNNKDLAAERVNILLASNRMDEAVAGMKQLVEKEPNNVQNVVNLAILYDNAAAKMGDDIRKLSDEAKKGGTLTKKLAAEKDALEAFNSEILRLGGVIKKNPKAAEAKRQLAEVQNRQKEAKARVAELEAQVKEEQSKGVDVAATEKKVADLKAKQTEQRDLAKQYYTKALAIDPNNYDANFNMGVFFYNEGAELNKALGSMDMAEYNKRGKEIEGQVCGRFKQALPYFMKAKAVKANEEDLNNSIQQAENLLKQYEERKVVCVETK
ncbi:tetratricopeptide repeat protein [Rudanella paleaurantiibacter]|uniref:Tetratricopeptide repeat protein n=1 Tax=Rudanella paleaurantiibacter TaxID=2614655 RepID=A0A7J5TXW1_9BACT|nr:tetratricopeptide repeat protein [Rudanella paleaurantiibacter]KAB7729972.1 tetratricopeptide repeat protein [Rudanella paleaurantiibacter]